MNSVESNISILTFLSLYPDTTYSMTYVFWPKIFRHVGSLEVSLNRIEFVLMIIPIVIKVVNKCVLAIKSVFQSLQFMTFWDIESFLAEEQTIQFRFTVDADGMAFLDASKGISGSVPSQSPLNVPLWVISTIRDYIFKAQEQVVRIEVPKYLQRDQNEGYYKSLLNDRSAKLESINLKQKSPYFYQTYPNIRKLLEKEKNMIDQILIKTMFLQRGSGILQLASMHQPETKAQAKFNYYTEREKQIFRSVRSKSLEYERWECKKD